MLIGNPECIRWLKWVQDFIEMTEWNAKTMIDAENKIKWKATENNKNNKKAVIVKYKIVSSVDSNPRP